MLRVQGWVCSDRWCNRGVKRSERSMKESGDGRMGVGEGCRSCCMWCQRVRHKCG
jgi:hypothetical protein